MKTMTEQETRAWWLLRRSPMDPKRSFLFHVDVVIEEDEPGLFGAHVVGMEDRMVAMGQSLEEATENACMLFMDTVDDAVESSVSFSFAIGNSDYAHLNIPISEAASVFEALRAIEHEEEEELWLRIPPPVIESQKEVVQH